MSELQERKLREAFNGMLFIMDFHLTTIEGSYDSVTLEHRWWLLDGYRHTVAGLFNSISLLV